MLVTKNGKKMSQMLRENGFFSSAGMIFALFLTFLLTACGGEKRPVIPLQPKPAPVEDPARVVWGFEPQGVRLIIRSDPGLNPLGETPLALSLCVYQLKSREFIDNLSKSMDGVYQLMACTASDPGISTAIHVFMQPGEEKIFTVDRGEGVKYLAVVAGFNEASAENSVKVLAMPVHVETRYTVPLLFSTTTYEATPMDAFVNIGPHIINLTGVERVR